MSVFQRGTVWWYEFQIDGERVRKSARTCSHEQALLVEAEDWKHRAQALGQADWAREAANEGFRRFAFGDFARWCASEHRNRPSTIKRYMVSVKALSEFFGNRPLEAMTAGDVERFKLYRSSQRRKHARDGHLVTPAGVNRDLAVLRIMMNLAVRLGTLEANPVKDVRFLREEKNCLRVLTAEEERRYLEASSPLLRDIATIMLDTGMRPSEVCQLEVADIDEEWRTLQIRRGKTVNARRFIPLTKRAFAVLQSRKLGANSQWLFPSRVDAEQPVRWLRRAHIEALQRSSVKPPFRLYDLRHTALSRMAMSGVDLSTLKELAGHSQIQMTMRYVHPTPEHKRKAIQRFEEWSAGGSQEATQGKPK